MASLEEIQKELGVDYIVKKQRPVARDDQFLVIYTKDMARYNYVAWLEDYETMSITTLKERVLVPILDAFRRHENSP